MAGLRGFQREVRSDPRARRNSQGIATNVDFIGGASVIGVDDGGYLQVDLATAGGLEAVSEELTIKLDSPSGLELSSDGLKVGVLTTKGDIFVHDGSQLQRLPIGTDNQALIADSAESLGVKWGDTLGGGLANQITIEDADTLDNTADREDIGYEQGSNTIGYYETKITDKDLFHVVLGRNDRTVGGGIRSVVDDELGRVLQVYDESDSRWKNALLDVRAQTDENNELEYKPTDSSLWLNVHSGDSDETGLNGVPVVQSYQASMGAYPAPEALRGVIL